MMSTTARSTPRGGKNIKVEATTTPKTQKSDTNKTESPKSIGLDKSQPTAEQMRMADILESKKDDMALKDNIKQVMDATKKTEDEVCTALHDCDYDPNLAVDYLLEGSHKSSEWSTSVIKKKKNRTATTKTDGAVNNHVGGSGEGEDWEQVQGGEVSAPTIGGRGRDRPRQRGGPPRLRGRGSMDSRQWRTRENKENERNLEDGYSSERGRRGGRMSNGPGRGGRGGRGGGRLGSRTFQSRDKPGPGFSRPMDTWNPSEEGSGEKMENWDSNGRTEYGIVTEDWDSEDIKPKPHVSESWADDGFPSPEDWDNEEYTGSLADSKVFTPSSGPEPTVPSAAEGTDAPENTLPPDQSTAVDLNLDIQPPARPPQLPPVSWRKSPVTGGTLTPAQTQYLTQLTQQSSAANSYAQQTQYPPPPVASVAYSTNYGVTVNSYGTTLQEVTPAPPTQALSSRNKFQKPRVPPPSKIPSSAVEMPPGDAVAVSLLDVQFGGLEFGSDSTSLDTSTAADTSNTTTTVPSSAPTPTSTAPTPTSVAASVASIMESYAAATVPSAAQQTNLANALAQSQKMTAAESLLQSQTEASYAAASTQQRPASNTVLTELTTSKTADTTPAMATSAAGLYQSQTYQKSSSVASASTVASYPMSTPVTTYNASSYTNSQVTSANTGYSSQNTGYTSSSSGGYGVSNSVSQSTPSVNSYPSSYSGSQASYAAYTSYPANTYQSSAQTYPPQSGMYQASAANSYPYQNSNYPQSAATAAAQQNHKINSTLGSSQGKDSQYESGQVTTNSIPSSTVSSTPSLGLSATSQSVASTKVTALSTANKSGMVAGIPSQVPQMMNTPYIMSQATGLPYFQQPVFSYDDALLLQQRIAAPPMPTGYFDMGFQQQPASLGTGRDGSMGNVAYSMSDGRFARADNNASPVPSTLSQQTVTQGHTQPMLNPTGLPPGYAYVYGGFPNFQYTTPTLYPMAPTAAAGNSTSGQYKGPGYGSTAGYGSGYDTGADGYKVGSAGGYSGSPAQTKAGGTPTTSTDLQPMYTKGHATLNKVNSYDKTGFHTGTPPPYNLTGSQSTGLAPSGTYAPHLFISALPPHQQHAHSAATLMHSHQPLHQDGASNSGPRSQATSQPNKAGTKQQNYSPSFWPNSS